MPLDAKHILILASWYPTKEQPFLGNFVQRHAQLLASSHEITVIHTEASKAHEDITIESKQEGKLRTITAYYPTGNRFSNRFRKYKAYQKALKLVENVDLIIGHVLLPNGWMFLEATRKKRAPLIWVEHGSYFRQDKKRKWTPYENWMRRRMKAISSEIVAVSNVLKTDMQRFLGRKKITVIGNHVDDQLFDFQPKNRGEKVHFLHISTLDENAKNPKGILQACHLLKKETSDFELTIVSDKDFRKWQKFTSESGLNEFVSFVGPLKWQEIPPYYHQADVFILFSDYETFSIVLAESLSTGTPIITTEVGIVPSLNENVAVRVEKENVHDLKNKMLAYINRELYFDTEAIREAGANFHSGKILSDWNQLIEKHAK